MSGNIKSHPAGFTGFAYRVLQCFATILATVCYSGSPVFVYASPASSSDAAHIDTTEAALHTATGNPQTASGQPDCLPVATSAASNTAIVPDFVTYLGGSDYDQARDVAVDALGNIYVTGGTRSRDFPATANLVRPGKPESPAIHDYDVFVAKYDPTGNLLWSTVLGGPNYDRAYGIEVDAEGNVYIGGRAGAGFPVTQGAAQTAFMGGQEAAHYGGQDGFVAKLGADGSRILWATYFGTNDFRIIRDIDIDTGGNVYIGAGYGEPATASGWADWFGGRERRKPPGWDDWFSRGIQDEPGGGHDAIVAKLDADGRTILWATYLGGPADDSFRIGSEPSVRVDSSDNVVVAIGAGPGLATTAGAYAGEFSGGESDVYVARIRADGTALMSATYIGTEKNDSPQGAHALAIDAADRILVFGFTQSADFPTTATAALRSPRGDDPVHALVMQLDPGGRELLASTYLHMSGEGIAIDACGNVYLSGKFHSSGFPATLDGGRNTPAGGSDGAIMKLSADLSAISFAMLIGGSSSNTNDSFRGVAVTPDGTVAVAGTAAPGWPLRNAYQQDFGGNGDVAVVRIRTGH
jgi:hypothetical protein